MIEMRAGLETRCQRLLVLRSIEPLHVDQTRDALPSGSPKLAFNMLRVLPRRHISQVL